MSTNLREYLKPFVRELEIRGLDHRLEHGGKHAKLMFVVQGKQLSLTIPKSSSDRRGWKNDLARLKRWLKPVPLTGTIAKTEEVKVEPKPRVAHVRFGIQSTGRLSATIPIADLCDSGITSTNARATITRSSEGRVIINFVPRGGILGSITKAHAVCFVFSRSKVPFKYGTRPVHGRSTKQLLGRFVSPESIVMDQQLPEAIMQLNKPQEPRLPLGKPHPISPLARALTGKSVKLNSDLPDDILEEGKAIREMFNDWMTRATKAGCSVTAKMDEGTLRIFASKPVEL